MYRIFGKREKGNEKGLRCIFGVGLKNFMLTMRNRAGRGWRRGEDQGTNGLKRWGAGPCDEGPIGRGDKGWRAVNWANSSILRWEGKSLLMGG